MLKKLIVGIIVFVMIITSVISSGFVFAESTKDFKIEGSHKIENINSGTRNIILESEDTGSKSTKNIGVNEKFEFNVSLPNLGTYKYKLYQEPITAEGLTQDNSIYFIECYVQNEENILIIKDKMVIK